jgi:hypothetical protein
MRGRVIVMVMSICYRNTENAQYTLNDDKNENSPDLPITVHRALASELP